MVSKIIKRNELEGEIVIAIFINTLSCSLCSSISWLASFLFKYNNIKTPQQRELVRMAIQHTPIQYELEHICYYMAIFKAQNIFTLHRRRCKHCIHTCVVFLAVVLIVYKWVLLYFSKLFSLSISHSSLCIVMYTSIWRVAYEYDFMLRGEIKNVLR